MAVANVSECVGAVHGPLLSLPTPNIFEHFFYF